MNSEIGRREFIQLMAASGAFCLAGSSLFASGAMANAPRLISPGCRRSKVKVARIEKEREADVRVYISDSTEIRKLSGWSPSKGPGEILNEIFLWIRSHEKMLKPILSS